jgi:acyl dehydratase
VSASGVGPGKGSLFFRRTYPPITRHALALYCGGSGDYNPIHVDSDFAKSAGYPDVFAHGMLVMAYLGRAITEVVAPSAIRSYTVRFVSITRVHAAITCQGIVEDVARNGTHDLLRLALEAKDEFGDVKLKGAATVASKAFDTAWR